MSGILFHVDDWVANFSQVCWIFFKFKAAIATCSITPADKKKCLVCKHTITSWILLFPFYANTAWAKSHTSKFCTPYWHTTIPHAYQACTTPWHDYGDERVNPHSTKPCKSLWPTSHLNAYSNERVTTPHSTKPCTPQWLNITYLIPLSQKHPPIIRIRIMWIIQ